MNDARYEWSWPRDSLHVECFVHEIMNYRYHWHQDKYELNILLNGSQEFCTGHDTVTLHEDDVILIPPGTGHGSFAPQANTRALVLQFSAAAFRPFVKKGTRYLFPECLSTEATRSDPRFCKLRYYASRIFSAAYTGSAHGSLSAKAALELLLVTLCEEFHPEAVRIPEENDPHQEAVTRLIRYIEQHYAEKITLEDMAAFSQYNRTYVSTLFKNTVGVNFHEYLTRVRFQHALLELAATDKTLTDIALDSGFAELKTFNAKFKEMLHRSPAEYRAQLDADRIFTEIAVRSYIPRDTPLIRSKLEQYDPFR